MEQQLYNYYSKPQQGFGFYQGQRLPQVGGGFLGGLARFLIPIAKFVGQDLFDIGVNSGRKILYENKPVKEAVYNSILNQSNKLINKNNVDSFIKNQKAKRRRLK